MPAIVIQDSDDEDLGSCVSLPSESDAADPVVSRTSTSRADAALDSTDPDYFQTIVDEQCGDAGRDPGASHSDVSGTLTCHIDPELEETVSSTAIVTIVETTSRGLAAASRTSRVKQRSLISQKKCAAEDETDDPWEFPGSSEEDRTAHHTKSLGGRRSHQNDSGTNVEATDMHEYPASPKKKRRKLSESRKSQSEIDSTDPLAMADIHTDRNTSGIQLQHSMLPPTQAVEGESSFLIVPTALTKSQREEYQSFPAQSSGQCSEDQGMTYRPNDAPIMISSGSATNINTPRSTMPFSRSLNASRPTQDHEKTDSPKAPQKQPVGRILSSIDEFAMSTPVEKVTPQVKKKQKKRQSRTVVESEDEQSDELIMDLGPAVVSQDDEDEDEDYGEVAAKPKKARGRPKKKKDVEEAEKPIGAGNASGVREAPTTETKRKRGRPKKTAARETETDATRIETPIKHNDDDFKIEEKQASATADSGEDAQKNLASGGELKPEPVDDDEETDEMTDVASNPPLKGKPREDEPAPHGGKAKDSLLESRIGAGSPGSWSASKPLYRVGLSKRSRIAPLLKVVRK